MTTHCIRPIGLLTVLGIAFSASVMAADVTSKAVYKESLASAQTIYKKAYAACPTAAGHERLECRKLAHTNLDKAQGDAREAHGMLRHAQGPRGGGG
jgi:hypothetical protein